MKYPYQGNLVKEYVNLRKKFGDNPRPSRARKLRQLERYMERTS
jgi:hypothetical protein